MSGLAEIVVGDGGETEISVRKRVDVFIDSVVEAAKKLSDDLIYLISHGGSESNLDIKNQDVNNELRNDLDFNCDQKSFLTATETICRMS